MERNAERKIRLSPSAQITLDLLAVLRECEERNKELRAKEMKLLQEKYKLLECLAKKDLEKGYNIN